MLIRLVHNQNTDGPLLVTDIESGLPNEEFGLYRKQPGVYVPYYRSFFGEDGLVEVDRDTPGFIDLVDSDKVKISRAEGVIASFGEQEFFDIVEIPSGALNAPTIDTGGATQTGTDVLTISGTNFVSFSPDVTRVLIDGNEVDAGDITVDNSSQIRVSTGDAHDGLEVVVIANGQASNTETVTAP